MEMGEKIHNLRQAKGMTLEQLGDLVGVGKSTVRKWENGMIANMRRDKIAKIADALQVSPAYLMGWEDTPEGTAAQEAPPEETLLVTDPMEQQLVKTYQILDDYGKRAVIRTANGEAERCLGTAAPGEKESSLPA